jgi:LacI family transcriptional regulator
MARVTLKHIAEAAGVSIASVSNALNGQTHRVTPETAERIFETARQLGYEKIGLSPSPKLGADLEHSHDPILIIMPASESNQYDQNLLQDSPFFNDFISGIEKGAEHCSVAFTFKRIATLADIERIASGPTVSGVIVIGSFPTEVESAIKQWSLKTIIVDNRNLTEAEENSSATIQAQVDDAKLGHLAIQHLVKLGHKNIALVFGFLEDSLVHRERFRGIQAFVDSHSKPIQLQLLETDVFFSEPEKQFARIQAALTSGVTAILCMSDIFALSVYREAHKAGLSIPYNFSLIGMDNIRLLQFMPFQLTTVDQHIVRRGYNAVMSLIEPHRRLPIKLNIIHGDTCRSISK